MYVCIIIKLWETIKAQKKYLTHGLNQTHIILEVNTYKSNIESQLNSQGFKNNSFRVKGLNKLNLNHLCMLLPVKESTLRRRNMILMNLLDMGFRKLVKKTLKV
jgi:hypothetical protein